MSESFYPRAVVARELAVSVATLLRYEGRGLVRATRPDRAAGDEAEGYGPVEVRRLWTIVTFQRDLGINLAGVEVILRLRDQMDATHGRLAALARDLRALADAELDGPEVEGEFR